MTTPILWCWFALISLLAPAMTGCDGLLSDPAAVVNEPGGLDALPASTWRLVGHVGTDAAITSSALPEVLSEFSIQIANTARKARADGAGRFEFDDAPHGNFTIEITGAGYLARSVTVDVVADVPSVIEVGSVQDPVVLWAGDLNRDNAINQGDVAALSAHFDPDAARQIYDRTCDLNRDGVIDQADADVILLHYNREASSYESPDLRPEIRVIPVGGDASR